MQPEQLKNVVLASVAGDLAVVNSRMSTLAGVHDEVPSVESKLMSKYREDLRMLLAVLKAEPVGSALVAEVGRRRGMLPVPVR